MKMEHVARTRRFTITPILWRKIHKWVGLILGLQFVLWTVSGAIMALLDMEKVGGHSSAAPVEVNTPWSQSLIAPATFGPVEQLTLRRIVDRPVYELTRGGAPMLVDAESGKPIIITADLAKDIATQAFHHDVPVRSVERLEKANLEAREHVGPMWRINYSDDENSSSYVSATTGRPLVNRGDTWRTWDFVWMLHNMDYVNRTSFNHPLIIFVAFGTLWLSFTGFYLLFKSFRRREFRWILGRK